MVTDFNRRKGTPGPKPKPIDWAEVKRLRDMYWRVGKIADHFNVSSSVMSKGMRKRGIK